MGLWLAAGLAVILAVIAVAAFARAGARRRTQDQLIDPRDEAELDAIFARITQEAAPDSLVGLERRLLRLLARGVPLRWVRPAAGPGRARLGFADGTVVVARSQQPATLGMLARHCRTGIVCPRKVALHDAWIEVDLAWPTGHAMVEVLGADQAD